MEYDYQSIPYIISNIVAVFLAIAAAQWPTMARILISFIFIAAWAVNVFIAFTNPASYLEFGEITPSELYRSVILGPFSDHPQLYITLIAIGQLLIGVFTSYKGKLMKIAMIGGMVFLVAICPLGFGSAFPSPLILAAAFMILLGKGIKSNVYEILTTRLHMSTNV